MSPICPDAPLGTIGTNFWVTCSSRGRNQLCKVLSLSVKGFGFYEWSKFDHSHWIAISPLTLVDGRPPVIYVKISFISILIFFSGFQT